jgi:hypothetical protein
MATPVFWSGGKQRRLTRFGIRERRSSGFALRATPDKSPRRYRFLSCDRWRGFCWSRAAEIAELGPEGGGEGFFPGVDGRRSGFLL